MFDGPTRELASALLEGNVVAFVGAGVSATAGMPTWDILISDLRSRLTPSATVVSHELTAQFFRNQHGERELIRSLRAHFSIGGARPSAVHRRLAALPINVFVTTNYDSLLETALRSREMPVHVICDDSELAQWNEATEAQVIKLHGDLDRATTIVLTSEDYSRFLHSNCELQKKLYDLLSFRKVVFFGYSLRDMDVSLVLDKLCLVYGRLQPHAFIVTTETDEHVLREWARRGVQPVPIGGADHEPQADRLLRFLDLIQELVQPPPPSPDVLIVDDDLGIRQLLTRVLSKKFAHASVREAANGLEACHAIGQRQPNVILLDLMMPEMNGFEFLDFVRARPEYQSLTIIIVSAARQLPVDEFTRLGVKAYIQKPFQFHELIETMVQLVPALDSPRSSHDRSA